MGKKRKNRMQKSEIEGQSEYYRLKTQAVDDLVNASEENSPPVSCASVVSASSLLA